MITALDTNVLIDILEPGAAHSEASESSLREAISRGSVISGPVYAELAAQFLSPGEPDRFLDRFGFRLEPISRKALHRAGVAWREYVRQRPPGLVCPECGASQTVRCDRCGTQVRARQHILADFIIGAHALVQADQLLTRDRGYYGTYFPELTLA